MNFANHLLWNHRWFSWQAHKIPSVLSFHASLWPPTLINPASLKQITHTQSPRHFNLFLLISHFSESLGSNVQERTSSRLPPPTGWRPTFRLWSVDACGIRFPSSAASSIHFEQRPPASGPAPSRWGPDFLSSVLAHVEAFITAARLLIYQPKSSISRKRQIIHYQFIKAVRKCLGRAWAAARWWEEAGSIWVRVI